MSRIRFKLAMLVSCWAISAHASSEIALPNNLIMSFAAAEADGSEEPRIYRFTLACEAPLDAATFEPLSPVCYMKLATFDRCVKSDGVTMASVSEEAFTTAEPSKPLVSAMSAEQISSNQVRIQMRFGRLSEAAVLADLSLLIESKTPITKDRLTEFTKVKRISGVITPKNIAGRTPESVELRLLDPSKQTLTRSCPISIY